jgi:hypothetical protein
MKMFWKKDYLGKIGYYLRIIRGKDYFHFNYTWEKFSILNNYWVIQDETKEHIVVKLIVFKYKDNKYLPKYELLKINKKELRKF